MVRTRPGRGVSDGLLLGPSNPALHPAPWEDYGGVRREAQLLGPCSLTPHPTTTTSSSPACATSFGTALDAAAPTWPASRPPPPGSPRRARAHRLGRPLRARGAGTRTGPAGAGHRAQPCEQPRRGQGPPAARSRADLHPAYYSAGVGGASVGSDGQKASLGDHLRVSRVACEVSWRRPVRTGVTPPASASLPAPDPGAASSITVRTSFVHHHLEPDILGSLIQSGRLRWLRGLPGSLRHAKASTVPWLQGRAARPARPPQEHHDRRQRQLRRQSHRRPRTPAHRERHRRAMFPVAVSGRRDREPSFFTVVVWRNQAEHAAGSLARAAVWWWWWWSAGSGSGHGPLRTAVPGRGRGRGRRVRAEPALGDGDDEQGHNAGLSGRSCLARRRLVCRTSGTCATSPARCDACHRWCSIRGLARVSRWSGPEPFGCTTVAGSRARDGRPGAILICRGTVGAMRSGPVNVIVIAGIVAFIIVWIVAVLLVVSGRLKRTHQENNPYQYGSAGPFSETGMGGGGGGDGGGGGGGSG
jgi:hypothetical protein